MKALTLVGLIFLSWTALGQSSDQHCISLERSRTLHELALKGIAADSMLTNRGAKIIVLENALSSQSESFNKELGHEREKVKISAELLQHQKAVSNSFFEQSEHFRKQSRKRGRQRNALGLLLMVVVGLSLGK